MNKLLERAAKVRRDSVVKPKISTSD